MQATLALAALSVRLPAAKTERVARRLVAAAARIGARLAGTDTERPDGRGRRAS